MSGPEPTPAKRVETIDVDEVLRTIKANQRAAEELWEPSPIIDHLLWQVCGGWETLVELVRGLKYTLLETPPPFVNPAAKSVHKDMRKLAREVNLRLPSDTIWTTECDRARTMRHNLGHMLHFKSIDRKPPNPSVTLARVAYGDSDEMSVRGEEERNFEPGEADMRMKFSAHRRIEVTITADEARAVLKDIEDVHRCARAIYVFGIERRHWPDTKPLGQAAYQLPWWCEEWGPRPGDGGWKMPTMRQVRIVPKAEFDASLSEGTRPEF